MTSIPFSFKASSWCLSARPIPETERDEEINKYGDTCGILTVKNSNKNKWE